MICHFFFFFFFVFFSREYNALALKCGKRELMIEFINISFIYIIGIEIE